MVKKLLIINAAIFLVQQFFRIFMPGYLEDLFGLSHEGLVFQFRVWQVFTYMFLHAGWMHVIFNLLALWMFAGELELLWGSRFFLRFYLLCGTGAGLFIAAMNGIAFQEYGQSPVTIGASGAIYGILLAYGMTWPNREVLLYFLFPIRMKYLVLAFGLIEFFGTLSTVYGAGKHQPHRTSGRPCHRIFVSHVQEEVLLYRLERIHEDQFFRRLHQKDKDQAQAEKNR